MQLHFAGWKESTPGCYWVLSCMFYLTRFDDQLFQFFARKRWIAHVSFIGQEKKL